MKKLKEMTNKEKLIFTIKLGKAKDLKDKGLSISDIAKELKISESTVRNWFNDYFKES